MTETGHIASMRVRAAEPDHARPEASVPGAHLVVRDLACRRGERVLFSGFDLDLAPGELVWLRAANGYGKTTLLRVLAGLSEAESGTIEWQPGDPFAHGAGKPPVHLAHANALKDDLTVAESLRYLLRLHGVQASETAMADAIRRFGLHPRRNAPIRFLSQGQRRRVALMRLDLSPPQATWILDEPYDALDTEGVALVSRLLTDHAARGGNALLTSHVPPPIDGVRTVHLDAPRATDPA